ncbi:MAG: serine/threonine protein kinase [Candidatus Polarisedimenticolaceae bacterium]|nr:serine/threonine protein kinase [Candidatus Polarisedimenticolaceae bacterium]
MSTQKRRDSLPAGTILDCYVIMKLIASGGFSLIYLAEDIDTQHEVVIKEFLPKKLAQRDDKGHLKIINEEQIDQLNRGRKLFYSEAKVLASLHHPNIVKVRGFFLDNNTGYLVMDYERGKNLASYIKRRKGGLSSRFLLTVFPPLLEALSLIHSRNMLHLDIKPGNIHLRAGGNPLLLDFGAVRQLSEEQHRRGQVVTPGFSPVEQYYYNGNIGPWSDIYAVGASMRACLDGTSPPSTIERHAKDKLKPASKLYRRSYPAYLLEAIDWAMELEVENRPQNADDLLAAIVNKSTPDLDNDVDPETIISTFYEAEK